MPYNSCRNFEWQVCAAQGRLKGQDGDLIRFAREPKSLDPDAQPPFNCCSGWSDKGCDRRTGFANDDIYYLEVCLFSAICHNREQLFQIGPMEDFRCSFDTDGYSRLQALLSRGPKNGDYDGVGGGPC